MKKIYFFIGIIILMLISLLVAFIPNYVKEINEKRIIKLSKKRVNEIRDVVDKEMPAYTNIIHPICEDNTGTVRLGTNDLIYNRGMSKELFLDIDNESFCKVNVYIKCVDNKNTWSIKVGCKDYQDKGFVDWGY